MSKREPREDVGFGEALATIQAVSDKQLLWIAEASTLLGMVGKEGIQQDKLVEKCRECAASRPWGT